MTNWRTWSLLLAFALLSFSGRSTLAQDSGEKAPVPWSVISIGSLDRARNLLREVTTDLPWRPLSSLLDRMDRVAELPGLSQTRPILLLTSADGERLTPPRLLLVIPVEDASKFVEACAARFHLEVVSTGENRWEIPEKGRTLTAVAIADNLLLMNEASLLGQASVVGEELLSVDDSLEFSFSFRPDGIPPALQQQLRSGILSPLESWRRKLSDKPGPDSALLQAMATFLEGLWSRWEGGTQRVDISLSMGKQWEIATRWIAVSGSKLSKDLTELKLPTARFDRVVSSSDHRPASQIEIAVDVPKPVRGLLSLMFSRVWAHVSQEVGPRLKVEDQQPAEGAFDAIASTISAGRFEAQLSFLPAEDHHLVLLGSIEVQKADRISQSLNTVLPYASQSGKIRNVQVDVIHQGELRVHQISLTAPHPDEVLLYGPDTSLFMGTNSQAFLFANGGPGATTHLKQLEFARIEEPDLVRMELHLRPWIVLLQREKPKRRIFSDLLKLLSEEGQGDLLEVRIQSRPDELRTQLSFDKGLLKLLGRVIFPPAKPLE